MFMYITLLSITTLNSIQERLNIKYICHIVPHCIYQCFFLQKNLLFLYNYMYTYLPCNYKDTYQRNKIWNTSILGVIQDIFLWCFSTLNKCLYTLKSDHKRIGWNKECESEYCWFNCGPSHVTKLLYLTKNCKDVGQISHLMEEESW